MEKFNKSLQRAVSENDIKEVEKRLSKNSQYYDVAKSTEGAECVNKCLHDVITHGNVDMIKLLVMNGADVNFENYIHQSVLSKAIYIENKADCLEITKFLLEKGANINHEATNGQSDFMFLMASGKLQYAYLMDLIKSVKNFNEHDCRTGGSYLHMVSCRPYDESKVAMLKILLTRGIPINGKDNNDDTPAHLMATIACAESLRFLLDQGADIRSRNRFGETILHNLASSNEFDGFSESLNLLIERGVDINEVDYKGRSVVHHSLLSKDTKCNAIKTMLKCGIKLNVKDNKLRNEMHYAVEEINAVAYSQEDVENRAEVIKFLANIGVPIDEGDIDGITPLHFATTKDELDILVTLLDLGADVTKRTRTGATALHWACKIYNMAHVLIHWHLWNDHSINIQDKYGSTPLHWAVWFRSLSVAQSLLQVGAKVNIKDNNGNSPLDLAQKLNYNDFSVLLTTYETLEPNSLKMSLECHGTDLIRACPLLRYIRKSNDEICIDEYLEHARLHETSVKQFINTVVELPNMGLYYDIQENQTIPAVFDNLMHKLARNVEQRNPLFRCELHLAGSMLEGTKVNISDEFDYIWNLKEFNKAFNPVQSNTFPKGFVKLLLKPEVSKSYFTDYIDADCFLDCKLLIRHFYSLLNEELNKLLEYRNKDQFEYISCVKYLDDICCSVSNLGFLYFGQEAKMMTISVDVVPAIWLGEWLPKGFPADNLMLLHETKADTIFSAVFKTPDRFHVKDFTLFYRLSYVYMEQRILKNIPHHIKKGYIILKSLAESGYFPMVIDHDKGRHVKQYITSYYLKTCFLHLLESSRREGSVDFEEVPESDEASKLISITWARKITDYFKTCIQDLFLPSYFDPQKNLTGVQGIQGVYDQSVFLHMISLLRTILDMF